MGGGREVVESIEVHKGQTPMNLPGRESTPSESTPESSLRIDSSLEPGNRLQPRSEYRCDNAHGERQPSPSVDLSDSPHN